MRHESGAECLESVNRRGQYEQRCAARDRCANLPDYSESQTVPPTRFTSMGARMKISHATLLALVFPLGLAAQQQPPATDPITAAFKQRIGGLHRNIAQAFDSIPESKFGYKPTPAQLTIGFIAQHVASDNYLFSNAFGDMKASLPEKDTSTPDSVKAKWPKDTLVAKLKASFKFCEDAFAQLDDSKLGDQVTLTFGG